MFKKRCQIFLFAGILALIVATNATANNSRYAFTLTPQVGVMVFEGNQNLDPGFTGGFGLGYNFGAHWGTEGVLTFARPEQNVGGGAVDISVGHLDLLYHFRPQERLVPYLALALGGMKLEDDKDLLAGYGVGFKYFYDEDVALRLDLKHLFDINNHDSDKTRDYYNMLVATVGVSFQFGGEEMAQLVNDSDADGVVDAVDRCPQTPAREAVDEVGCPKKKVPARIPDSDGDGVADNLDLCPGTETGIAIDATGCPVVTDKDLDGVVDALDACPETPAKTVVDVRGCPAHVALVAPVTELPEPAMTFYLEYLPNATEVSPAFAAEMQKMADFVQANPGRRFAIEGHTDSIGNDAANMKLSLLRAEKIKAYLVEKTGVSASLFEARGFGESNPVADNNTQAGRQQNRRVVIIALPR